MCKFLHGHILSFLLGRYLELELLVASVLSLFSHVHLCATLWTVACQAPLSMGCSRQEYWSGLPCPPPGDLSDPGIESMSLTSPALAGKFFTTSTTWEAIYIHENSLILRINFKYWLYFKIICCCCFSVANSCPTVCNLMDSSTPGSSIQAFFQTRILEWVAISFSRGFSGSGIEPMSPALAGGFFTTEPPGKPG